MEEAYDPELVSAWLRARLLASPALAALVGSRLWDEVGVPPEPTFPYVYWNGLDELVAQRTSGPQAQEKIQSMYSVRAVHQTTLAGASYRPLIPIARALKAALCPAQAGTAVNARVIVEGQPAGWVWATRFARRWKPPPLDRGQVRVLELGVTFQIWWSCGA